MIYRSGILAGILIAAGISAQVIEEAVVVGGEEKTVITESVPVVKEPVREKVLVTIDTSSIENSEPKVTVEFVSDTLPEDRKNSASGGFGFGVYAFDMSPVKQLISVREQEEKEFSDTKETLRISGYNFLNEIDKREAIPAFRGVFYGVNESKFRIGGLFEVAGRTWRVKNIEKDSTVTMGFISGKMGVLMEQVLVHNDKNYLSIGGVLGGGGNGVGFFGREGSSSFWEDEDYDYDYDDDEEDNDFIGAGSGFVFFDANLTYIFSATKNFHLRFDAICNVMGSRNGYNLSGDDYGIVNTGGALSFVWGRQ